MEIFGLIDIPSWLMTIFLLVFTLYLYTVWKHSLWKRLGIPGPTPFPFLGNLKDSAVKGLTKHDIDLVNKYGSVVGTYMGSIPSLIVSDPDMIKEIFIKENQTFTNRVLILKSDEVLDCMITAAEDDHWKFLRSTMTPTFTSGKLKHMVPMIQQCCDDLVTNIASRHEEDGLVEMKAICSGFTIDVIASTAFGLQVNSQKEPNTEFVANATKLVTSDIFKPYFLVVMVFPFMKNIVGTLFKAPIFGGCEEYFKKIVRDLIAERKSDENKYYRDFIQLMLNAHKNPDAINTLNDGTGTRDLSSYKNRGMTENEILMNSLIFFSAGFDTTANTLAFAVYTLALHQDVQAKLIQEIDTQIGKNPPTYECLADMTYLDKFLSEVLRLYAAAVRINRMTKNDITINGVFIPKGTDVTIPISALHRNPKYWPDPDKFDPERFTEENKAKRPLYSYLPFGLGPRNCIGMRLALLEAKFALIAMSQNYKFMPSEKTEDPILIEKGFLTRPLNGVYLKIEKR